MVSGYCSSSSSSSTIGEGKGAEEQQDGVKDNVVVVVDTTEHPNLRHVMSERQSARIILRQMEGLRNSFSDRLDSTLHQLGLEIRDREKFDHYCYHHHPHQPHPQYSHHHRFSSAKTTTTKEDEEDRNEYSTRSTSSSRRRDNNTSHTRIGLNELLDEHRNNLENFSCMFRKHLSSSTTNTNAGGGGGGVYTDKSSSTLTTEATQQTYMLSSSSFSWEETPSPPTPRRRKRYQSQHQRSPEKTHPRPTQQLQPNHQQQQERGLPRHHHQQLVDEQHKNYRPNLRMTLQEDPSPLPVLPEGIESEDLDILLEDLPFVLNKQKHDSSLPSAQRKRRVSCSNAEANLDEEEGEDGESHNDDVDDDNTINKQEKYRALREKQDNFFFNQTMMTSNRVMKSATNRISNNLFAEIQEDYEEEDLFELVYSLSTAESSCLEGGELYNEYHCEYDHYQFDDDHDGVVVNYGLHGRNRLRELYWKDVQRIRKEQQQQHMNERNDDGSQRKRSNIVIQQRRFRQRHQEQYQRRMNNVMDKNNGYNNQNDNDDSTSRSSQCSYYDSSRQQGMLPLSHEERRAILTRLIAEISLFRGIFVNVPRTEDLSRTNNSDGSWTCKETMIHGGRNDQTDIEDVSSINSKRKVEQSLPPVDTKDHKEHPRQEHAHDGQQRRLKKKKKKKNRRRNCSCSCCCNRRHGDSCHRHCGKGSTMKRPTTAATTTGRKSRQKEQQEEAIIVKVRNHLPSLKEETVNDLHMQTYGLFRTTSFCEF